KAGGLGRQAQQAEYMAYAAELLLNAGRLIPALSAAQTARTLARLTGSAWPLAVAVGVSAAALRSLARYDEAQAVIHDARGELARLEPPQSAARAAMAAALLDLEQMDLLRHFKRLDEARML